MTDPVPTSAAVAEGPLNPYDLTARTVHRTGSPQQRHTLHYYWSGVWIIDQASGLWGPTGYANTLAGWAEDGWVVEYADTDVTDRVAFSPSEPCGQLHPLRHSADTGLWRMDECPHPRHTAATANPSEMSLPEWEQHGWHISVPAPTTHLEQP